MAKLSVLLAQPPTKTARQGKLSQLLATSTQAERPVSHGIESLIGGAIGGIPTAIGTPGHAEEALPLVGQTLGDVVTHVTPLGVVPGASFAGNVVGAGLGETGRQTIRSLFRGQRFNAADIAKSTAATAATEGVLRGAGKLFFNKQIGGTARQAVGEQLGKLKTLVAERFPTLRMSTTPIIEKIDAALAKYPFERTSGHGRSLTQLRNELQKMGKTIDIEKAMGLETRLGEEATFANKTTRGVLARLRKGPNLNTALKTIRADLSSQIDTLAEQASVPEFPSVSKQFSRLATKFPEEDLQRGFSVKRGFGLGGLGTLAGLFPPLRVPAAVIGAVEAIPPKTRTTIFRKFVEKPSGRTFRSLVGIGTGETARRALRST